MVYYPRGTVFMGTFILSFLTDLFTFTPLGSTAIETCLIMAFVLTQRQSLIRKSFWVLWSGLGVVMVLDTIWTIVWAQIMTPHFHVSYGIKAQELILSLLWYPALARIFMECYKRFYKPLSL
jgi:cell shape-determining protein MreD